jgi:hypothetical protein
MSDESVIMDITETDEAVLIKVPVTVTTTFEVMVPVVKNGTSVDDIVTEIEAFMSSTFDMDEMADGNYSVSCEMFEWEPFGSDYEFDMDSVTDQVNRMLPDEEEDED